MGWQDIEIGDQDFSDVEEYQGDRKLRTPEALYESLVANREEGTAIAILCEDPTYGYVCEDQEPGSTES